MFSLLMQWTPDRKIKAPHLLVLQDCRVEQEEGAERCSGAEEEGDCSCQAVHAPSHAGKFPLHRCKAGSVVEASQALRRHNFAGGAEATRAQHLDGGRPNVLSMRAVPSLDIPLHFQSASCYPLF